MSIHGVVAVLGIGVELGYVYEGAANLGELTRAANESTGPVICPSLGARFGRLRFACADALDEYLISFIRDESGIPIYGSYLRFYSVRSPAPMQSMERASSMDSTQPPMTSSKQSSKELPECVHIHWSGRTRWLLDERVHVLSTRLNGPR